MKTREELIKDITEKCHEANPKLRELSFGCKTKWRDEEYAYISDGMAGEYTLWNARCSAVFASPSQVTILGHPITLPDVLMAIDSTIGMWSIDEYENMPETEALLRIHWNLLEPLTGQSDETITFIHNLIFKKL